ncbi:MAG: efflux RND transporter periplasmic adaptor subunit [Bacteroidales bacterium]|nr:efflux RND transporter periplasmic adaptor subunit [Bacteroidales bacterium]MBQ9186110.1 efflux RND transporter periplasmic adaptor subunit [Bacteroidales bacterium]
MKQTTFKTIILGLGAAAMVSCGGSGSSNTAQTAVAPTEVTHNVEVVSASFSDVPQQSSYSSTIEAFAVNNIAPQSAGRIRKINAEVGDYVTKGQVLAEMDRIQLDQLKLQLQNDSTEYSRIKALFQQGGVSQSDFEAVELAYKVRKTNYKNLLENTVLRAPITGFVTARNYDEGDMYSMAQPLFTVQQVLPVKLLVGISESEYTKVKKGDKVEITVDALPGRTFTGNVNRLYPVIDAATHTFQAEVQVPNADRILRPGMYARVTVTFGVNHSVVLPDQAVVKMEGTGQKYVYIVNDKGTVNFVPVELGVHNGFNYEILSGVNEGDIVVVKGAAALKEGAKVKIINK